MPKNPPHIKLTPVMRPDRSRRTTYDLGTGRKLSEGPIPSYHGEHSIHTGRRLPDAPRKGGEW